jgi:hypothetical protein
MTSASTPTHPSLIVNLTPHAIALHHTDASDGSERILTLPSSGVLRLESAPQAERAPLYGNDYRVRVTEPQRFIGFASPWPAFESWTTDAIIVSAVVGEWIEQHGIPQVRARTRVFSPGELVRDAKGNIVGARTLCEHRKPPHPPTDECGDVECTDCAERDCPHHEPLHYHHDGCPACVNDSLSRPAIPSSDDDM